MHFFVSLLALLALGVLAKACASPFDSLRAKTEDLGETLYVIGSWMDPWLNIVPKETFPEGAGYVRSAFTIERSEPGLDEEPWNYIQSIADTSYGGLDAAADFQSVRVGHKENTYKPERLPLVGPLVGQDDLVMYWHSKDFWAKYFKQMEMRSIRSISNRLCNIYMRFIPKYSCNASLTKFAGVFTPGTTAASGPDMSGVSGQLPSSALTQEMLDQGAVELIQEGAYDPNTQGWLSLGPDGPIFPLLIGLEASQNIFTNNSEFRSDLNQSFQGWGELNPVIKRMGASRVIKNFRHVVTPFPPRWAYNAGAQKAIGSTVLATDSSGATTQLNTVAIPANSLYRIPVWSMSTNTTDVTKGAGAIVNPIWADPATAPYEAAISLHPWVLTEEVLKPLMAAPGMKWNPQNYFGEWEFVTGNDALLGFDTCTGIADPTKKLGRHFAYYRHALKPVFPQFGRMWVFLRCTNSFTTLSCS
jgi:hypothetical protein